jgi:hypothetical protein
VRAARGQVARRLVNDVAEAHVEIEILRRDDAGERVRANQAVVVAAEGEVQRDARGGIGAVLTPPDVADSLSPTKR